MNRRDFIRASGALLTIGPRALAQNRAVHRRTMADVVIVIPGIMGSVLQKDGKDLWNFSGQTIASNLRSWGTPLNQLLLPSDSAAPDLGDGIVAARIMPDIHLIPGFWKIDGYSRLREALLANLDLVPNQNFFEFPYDWRRDNRVAARRLERQANDWLTTWRSRSGHSQAKLILIAHSMGGLVGRYFVECLEGWRVTRRLVTFGTPFRGSVNALNTLANGLAVGSFRLESLAALARSFTSVYQLLPRYPCYDAGNGTLVRVGETSRIPNVSGTLAAQALAFHHEIDACVEAHVRMEAYNRSFEIHPIVGGYQTTFQLARWRSGRVDMETTYPQSDWDGDGTVPEVSAVPLELSEMRRQVYVAQRHASLQNTAAVLEHVIKLLSADDTGSIRFGEYLLQAPHVDLRMSDAYVVGEPITVRAVCSEPATSLNLHILDAQSGSELRNTKFAKNSSGSFDAVLAPFPEGLFRAIVRHESFGPLTSDVFAVLTPN